MEINDFFWRILEEIDRVRAGCQFVDFERRSNVATGRMEAETQPATTSE